MQIQYQNGHSNHIGGSFSQFCGIPHFLFAKLNFRSKKSSKTRYWKAKVWHIGKFKYVTIILPLSFSKALTYALMGGNVFAVTKSEARTLANRFCGVIGPEKGKSSSCCNQYYHYHIMNRKYKNQHIFYLF